MATTATPEHRLEPRSNLFVIATLYGADGWAPVRIRNLSQGGALIEGAVLAAIGAEVQLSRGSLTVIGRVVWLEGNKAGVRFTGRIAVADWLPSGKPGSGQQLADELVHQARLGALPTVATPTIPPPEDRGPKIADELMRLCRLLEQAGEDLVADEALAERHPGPLQAIDMAAQALAKLATASGNAVDPPLSGSAAL